MTPGLAISEINVLSAEVYHSESPTDVLTANGFTVVGSGTGRIVVTPSDTESSVVVKFAHSETAESYAEGLVQNRVERYLATTPTPLAPFLLPLYAYPTSHARWLVYPRVATATHDSSLFRVFSELDELGYSDEELFAPEHWGWFKDEWHLVDFGYFSPAEHKVAIPESVYEPDTR